MAFKHLALSALAAGTLAVGGAVAQDPDGALELPRDVVEAATAFEAYTAHAAAIGAFSGSDSVAGAVRTGATYEPVQFEEGMIGYGAIAALQDDAFVQGVNRAAEAYGDRAAFADRLLADPTKATQIDGAADAAQHIEAAFAARSAPLIAAGADVKASAYSIQHQAWSQVFVADAQARLAEVKRLSVAHFQPADGDSAQMLQALAASGQPATPDAFRGGFTAVEAQSLALAAEAVLDRARTEDRPRLTPLLSEPRGAECLKMAKLNLYQCMAVAGPQYEDIFCLGQHAMMDTGACVAEASGGAPRTLRALSSAPSRPVYLQLSAHRSLRVAGQ
jgi:hypothetical protein